MRLLFPLSLQSDDWFVHMGIVILKENEESVFNFLFKYIMYISTPGVVYLIISTKQIQSLVGMSIRKNWFDFYDSFVSHTSYGENSGKNKPHFDVKKKLLG